MVLDASDDKVKQSGSLKEINAVGHRIICLVKTADVVITDVIISAVKYLVLPHHITIPT